MLLNKNIPVLYVVHKVKYEALFVIALATTVSLLKKHYIEALPDIPLAITAIMGTAISILLSFKLNQSYDRWWEARKLWGSIVNDSRSFVMQLQSLVNTDEKETIKKMALRQIAWCYALSQSLRGYNMPQVGLQKFLNEDDFAYLNKHNNKPLALMQQHREDLSRLKQHNKLELFAQLQLDSTLVRLCDAMGGAERIKNTVFPVTYRIFLHFIIYIFVVFLSISLKDVPLHFEILILLVISVGFFLLERSATYMQDPFENKPTDTAMSTISRTIEINILQLIGEENVPQPLKPESFYSM
ncbi:MAG: hypothetical protein F9K23_01100 [Bacteroidetes bacterium]|nr:MAG: hypothetical protein F9K23_01100 [Bacteroidota bacterium]